MNDEQFEVVLDFIRRNWNSGGSPVSDLRARDTAQREALARAEEDKSSALRVLARQVEKSGAVIAELAAVRSQMAEAVGLIDQHFNDLGDACCSFESQHDVDTVTRFLDVLQAFLARHAQAEQQEAQEIGPLKGEFAEAAEQAFREQYGLGLGAQPVDEWSAFLDHWLTDTPAEHRDMVRKSMTECRDAGQLNDAARKSWEVWQARAALAAKTAVPVTEHPVVKALLEVAAAADYAMDNTEDDGKNLTLWRSSFDRLSSAMDALDALPDDQPGYVMGAAAKADWALRGLNAVRGAEHE